jgi:hypothetical protein
MALRINQKIVCADIVVNQPLRMDFLDRCDE